MRPTLGGRRIVLSVVVLATLAALTGAAITGGQSGQPSGEAVLNDTRDRYATAESVVTSAEVTVSNGTANETTTVEFATAGNQSRTVVTTENATYRTGVNETVAWYVGPNRTAAWDRESAARPGRNGSATLDDRSLDDHENVSVAYLREGSDDGTDAHVIEMTHEGDRTTTATLWVAQSDSRLLRAETTDGTNRTVIDYRDTQFNVSIHESTFDPPADRLAVTSVERYDTFGAVQANTSLDLPSLDATFREASVIRRSSSTTVGQEYRAGGDNVTVVSSTSDREFDSSGNATTVTVNGHDANVTTMRDRAVVYWRTDGVWTAVVVDGSEDRAVELARRLDG